MLSERDKGRNETIDHGGGKYRSKVDNENTQCEVVRFFFLSNSIFHEP